MKMKIRISLILFILFPVICYSQYPVYFFSSKMDIIDIEKNTTKHKTGDYKYLVDVKNKTLGLAVYNNESKNYDIFKTIYDTKYTSKEGLTSFYYKENGSNIIVLVDTNKEKISILDDKENKLVLTLKYFPVFLHL